MQHSNNQSKQSPSLKARALRLLSKREYSRKELSAKLKQQIKQNDLKNRESTDREKVALEQIDTAAEIEAILDDFAARGWQSDERYAEARIRTKGQRYGQKKIMDDLERAGVDLDKANGLIEQLKNTELERAKVLWGRKFGMLASNLKEHQKQYRFLLSKGFSADIVGKIVGRLGD